MARTARLHVKGGIFHLISRFARDEYCLDRAGGRDAYLALLAKAAARTDAKILAYCLMSNHVHLVVQQGEQPLARFMKSVHTGFAQWFHRAARRTKAGGAVFAGRARSVLVEADAYLMQLVRYLHNNPVRAGVVRHARDSKWSSHRAYLGRGPAPAWLHTAPVLARLGRGARESFDRFVEDGRAEPRRPELSGVVVAGEAAMMRRTLGDAHRLSDGVLGTNRFTDRVREARERFAARLSAREQRTSAGAARPEVREVVDACIAALGIDPLDMKQRPKARMPAMAKRLAIWTWVHEYGGTQSELARALGLHTSVVSRYYGQALEAAGDFDEMASPVVRSLRRKKGKKATSTALPVRYHVDVDEV